MRLPNVRKIRTLTEAQARRAWDRLVELQQRGYTFVIKRRGKAVARLEPIRPTISSRTAQKAH
jgi:antitoxin (DNA-binding transcriptional repressor) of toxin-antitoxin stability system